MKSKEEAIKEKWIEVIGEENFDKLNVDENGFEDHYTYATKTHSVKEHTEKYFNIDKNTGLIRPKSLQGIDDNFGWISINSEKDLPNMDQLTYDVCCIGNRILEDVSLKDLLSLNESKILTHYSIHEKRLKPLHK